MSKGFAIAIDGPVAAGKGTIAPLLAKRLNGFYLYTGAMYRCLALLAIEKGVDLTDEDSLVSLLSDVRIEFENDRIILNGKDVTNRIKDEDVASASSKVAVISKIRKHVVSLQQQIAEKAIANGKIVVAEGRDTGTKVMPSAKLKIFLTATPEVRAKRRLEQLKVRGEDLPFEKVLSEVQNRDERDKEREMDPLVSNPKEYGYFVLDNSNLSKEETLDIIEEKVKSLDD